MPVSYSSLLVISLSHICTVQEDFTELTYGDGRLICNTQSLKLDIVTKTKIEFLNPSNQKMFIFYRKICKKIIFSNSFTFIEKTFYRG